MIVMIEGVMVGQKVEGNNNGGSDDGDWLMDRRGHKGKGLVVMKAVVVRVFGDSGSMLDEMVTGLESDDGDYDERGIKEQRPSHGWER